MAQSPLGIHMAMEAGNGGLARVVQETAGGASFQCTWQWAQPWVPRLASCTCTTAKARAKCQDGSWASAGVRWEGAGRA